MFYRNSDRSTVLSRLETQRIDHENATEESDGDKALLDARRRSERQTASKLSNFEKELMQAWAQD